MSVNTRNLAARIVGTFGYVGHIPVAPGTLASAVAVAMVLGLRGHPWVYAAVLLAVTAAGWWAAGIVEKEEGKKDPGCVVIDEVAGMMIAMAFLPPAWPLLIVGFFLFRAFDMFKIYPADKLESMGGGLGIMADDIAAGIYTNLVLQVALRMAGWL